MAIVGRDLDISERKVAFQWTNQYGGQSLAVADTSVIQTGSSLLMFQIPFPCVVQSGSVYSNGLSGAPQINVNVLRFAGGATSWALGISNMVLTTFGTSGVQGLSGLGVLPIGTSLSSGSSLLYLLPGDTLWLNTAAANTAIGKISIELVVRKTQDIVAYNNVSS